MLIPLLYLKLDHTPTVSCLYYLNEWPRVCYPIFDMNCYVWGKSVAEHHLMPYTGRTTTLTKLTHSPRRTVIQAP